MPKLWAPSPAGRLGLQGPQELAPPPGNEAALALDASGIQKYECRAGDNGFAWAFIGPEAKLYNADDKLVGKHFAGPSWEYQDGSKVVGAVMTHLASQNPHSVDQLLLRAASHDGAGVFARVSFIPRVRTFGGAAPTEPCNSAAAGTKKDVEYSAQYVFYTPN